MSDASILIVDDDRDAVRVLARVLHGFGDLRFATGGAEALKLLRAQPADLVLLDHEMPGMSGLELCAAMKADPVLAEVPVMLVTSHADDALHVAGLQAGAVDFVVKPVNPRLLLSRVKTQLRLKRSGDLLRHASDTDGLTGVANRRRFDDALHTEWQRARRGALPIALLLVDIDRFKDYNDLYGHLAGDACLQAVAQAMDTVPRRAADLLARYGGEEFALLLPDTLAAGAEHVARALLGAVDALAIPHEGGVQGWVSISVGLAGVASETERPTAAAELLSAADAALYAAKAAGRCCLRRAELSVSAASATADPAGPVCA